MLTINPSRIDRLTGFISRLQYIAYATKGMY
jgi:hypothetical protein